MAERKTPQSSQTANRALEVLFTLLRAPRPLSLGEISSGCGYAPSTTHRLASSLVRYNLVRQDAATSRYSLGLGLLEFSHAILNSLDVRELATPALNDLNARTEETIHLAVLDGLDIVYIDRRDTPHGLRLNTSIGRRGTPHTTGVGKALLAFSAPALVERYLQVARFDARTPHSITDPQRLRDELELTRARGYAIDRSEDKPNIFCVAAPILDAGNGAVAAISISVPDSRLDLEGLLDLVPTLLEHTHRLGRSLGCRLFDAEGGGAAASRH